jgi:hypothetical protein
MRVVRWLGCTSGRIDHRTDSFGSGQVALYDSEGHAAGEVDTRLPSERLGRKPVLSEPSAPLVYTKPKRLTVGASA